ncbi:MAG TPA: A/G-specific adenine glycosylase [Gammaproteobacteria bacterium]|nr:A/G-specific adenine glycosylase [Gammaproteobacteria bacterium]
MQPAKFSRTLLDWYDHQGRKDLPWRQDISPYRVWISEIMLQQTQVKTVIPYFQRFMQYFPTLPDLANASEDEILHLWTGLGYYARARNMHRAAKTVLEHHAGNLPDSLQGLQSLPGVGRSTAGAILAISWNKRAPILDGNVKRVLTRFHTLSGSPSQASVAAKLWQYAEQYTPTTRVGDYTQAIMDLGARVCVRAHPRCHDCPLVKGCMAYKLGKTSAFPQPKTKKRIPVRSIRMLIFYEQRTQKVLLEKRPSTGVWGGLWSFPECPVDVGLEEWCRDKFGYSITNFQQLTTFKHIFTHFQLNITPLLLSWDQRMLRVMDSPHQVWYKLNNTNVLGLASPVKRLLEQLASLELT